MWMILIFSDDTTDISAFDVCDWLNYLNQEFLIINEKSSKIEFAEFHLSNTKQDVIIIVNNKRFCLNDIKSYYWRRGSILFMNGYLNTKFYSNSEIGFHIFKENKILSEEILKILERKRKIGSFFSNINENKLTSLNIAKSVGLDIPDTLICTDIKSLNNYIKSNNCIVTKAISEGISVEIGEKYYYQYTEAIQLPDLPGSTNSFFPTLFQEKLDKEYELRVFYLHCECYTMAIFSQNDNQTSVDFRKYNWQKPNRTVPYNLPIDIKDKLIAFMSKSKLDTGSIDIVYTKEGRYVFLEVNPVGQFGMVSEPCNLFLEKKIAEYLKGIN
jgi:ATP-GRASP peptide maturase of grasp-with-spasm system